MKQCKYIWVETREMNWAEADECEVNGLEKLEGNSLICMTIEELRECFKWGMGSAEDTCTPAQSFNEFLQSKGIQLIENQLHDR
jgi:hypothetical protein